MGEYDRQIETAKRLIAKKGQAVIWRQIDSGMTSDPNKPWLGGEPVTQDFPAKIVFLPDDKMNSETESTARGTDIPVGHQKALMAAVDFVPNVNDVIVVGNVLKPVLAIDPFAPNGDIIYYDMRIAT